MIQAFSRTWEKGPGDEGELPTRFRYTGQREEAGIGLYFYGARWYDAALGRFTSADTIVPGEGNPQAWDRYQYCFGNPLIYIDPSGHIPLIDGEYSVEYATKRFGRNVDDPESGDLSRITDTPTPTPYPPTPTPLTPRPTSGPTSTSTPSPTPSPTPNPDDMIIYQDCGGLPCFVIDAFLEFIKWQSLIPDDSPGYIPPNFEIHPTGDPVADFIIEVILPIGATIIDSAMSVGPYIIESIEAGLSTPLPILDVPQITPTPSPPPYKW